MDARLRLGLMAGQAVLGAAAIPYVLTKAGNWALDRLGIQDANDENAGVLDEQAELREEARRARAMKRRAAYQLHPTYRAKKPRTVRVVDNRPVVIAVDKGPPKPMFKTPKGKGPASASRRSVRLASSGPAMMSVRSLSFDDAVPMQTAREFVVPAPSTAVVSDRSGRPRLVRLAGMARSSRGRFVRLAARGAARWRRGRGKFGRKGVTIGGYTARRRGNITLPKRTAVIRKGVVAHRPRDPMNAASFSRTGAYRSSLRNRVPLYRAVEDIALGVGIQMTKETIGGNPTWRHKQGLMSGYGFQEITHRNIPPIAWSVKGLTTEQRNISPFFLDMVKPSTMTGFLAPGVIPDPNETAQYLYNSGENGACLRRSAISIVEQQIILELGIDTTQIAYGRAGGDGIPGAPRTDQSSYPAGRFDPSVDPPLQRMQDKFRIVVLELRGSLPADLVFRTADAGHWFGKVDQDIGDLAETSTGGSGLCPLRMERFFETAIQDVANDETVHGTRQRYDFYAPVLPTPRVLPGDTDSLCDILRSVRVSVLYDKQHEVSAIPSVFNGYGPMEPAMMAAPKLVQVPIVIKKRYSLDMEETPGRVIYPLTGAVALTTPVVSDPVAISSPTRPVLHAENVNIIIFAIPLNGCLTGNASTSFDGLSAPTPSYVWGGQRRFTFEVPDPKPHGPV